MLKGTTTAVLVLALLVPATAGAAKIDAKDVRSAELKTKSLRSVNQDNLGGTAHCPNGTRVLTGGAYWHKKGKPPKAEYKGLSAELTSSRPSVDGKGWFASGVGEDKFILEIEVLCLPAKNLKDAAPMTVSGFPPDGGAEGGFLSCPSDFETISGGVSWATSFENEDPDDAFRALTASSTVTGDSTGWYADGTDNWVGQPPVLGIFIVVRCLPSDQLGKTVLRSKNFEATDDEVVGGTAKCPKETEALTGGGYWNTGGNPTPDSNEGIFGGSNGFTKGNKGWFASGNNFNAGGVGGTRTLTVQVLCLK